MKVIVASLLLALAVLASAKSINQKPTAYNYHNRFGIPAAARLAEAEKAGANSRITGGTAAYISDVPFQVALFPRIAGVDSLCGGTLLSTRQVLSAAHCQDDGVNQATAVEIFYGTTYLFRQGYNYRYVNTIFVHPLWNPEWIHNDIAVFRFPEIILSGLIQPVALPTGDLLTDRQIGETVTISGYGHTRDGGSITTEQRLRTAQIPIVSNDVCFAEYGNYVQDNNICAATTGGISPCFGDSGGPAFVNYNGVQTIVGVISFGAQIGCELDYPAAFTRVASHIDWIQSTLIVE